MSGPGGKVALVTGGARRIGAAISRRLARDGFSVALTFLKSRREARFLAREIGGWAFPLDLRRPADIPRLVRAVETHFGRLDLLVHNAAVFPRTPVGTVSARDWDEVFAVNLRGPFLLTQAFLPLLRAARPGTVLFLGDAGAAKMWPGHIPYCLSKIALGHLSDAWRRILAPEVRIGSIRPGLALIPEDFPEGTWRRLRSRRDIREPDSPDKVADSVLRFLRT